MLLPDPTIDVRALASLISREFGHDGPLAFVPAGGGSWCYRAGPWWISVRRDRGGHAPAAYEAAVELRRSGLSFVVAPEIGRSGRAVLSLAGRPVVVTTFLEGDTEFKDGLSPTERDELRSLVERLHRATVNADVPSDDFSFHEAELAEAIDRARSRAAAGGPFSALVFDLVDRNATAVAAWRAEAADLQRVCRRLDHGEFVLTHGEADPPNLLRTPDGSLRLFDWGDLRRAPAERDSRALRALGIETAGRAPVLRFYELRWILSEVAEYVMRFVRPHVGDAADQDKLRELRKYLE